MALIDYYHCIILFVIYAIVAATSNQSKKWAKFLSYASAHTPTECKYSHFYRPIRDTPHRICLFGRCIPKSSDDICRVILETFRKELPENGCKRTKMKQKERTMYSCTMCWTIVHEQNGQKTRFYKSPVMNGHIAKVLFRVYDYYIYVYGLFALCCVVRFWFVIFICCWLLTFVILSCMVRLGQRMDAIHIYSYLTSWWPNNNLYHAISLENGMLV